MLIPGIQSEVWCGELLCEKLLIVQLLLLLLLLLLMLLSSPSPPSACGIFDSGNMYMYM